MKNQARMCTAAMVVRALQPRLHDLKAPVSAPMSAPAKAERHGTTSMRWRRHPICVLTTAKGRAHRAAAEGVVVRVQTAQTVETIAPRSATNTLRPSRPMLPLSAQPAAISASPWLLRRCRQSRWSIPPRHKRCALKWKKARTPRRSVHPPRPTAPKRLPLAAAVRAVETAQSLPPAHARPPRLVHAVRVLGVMRVKRVQRFMSNSQPPRPRPLLRRQKAPPPPRPPLPVPAAGPANRPASPPSKGYRPAAVAERRSASLSRTSS